MLKKAKKLRDDPVLFAKVVLGFDPFPYQEKLLRDNSKRIVACMGRQTGKTTINAIRAIHFAYCNPKTLVLIVSPSLRQSMIMFDRILDLIYSNPWLPKSVIRKTRTLIHLDTGSRIIALPCSANLLRGYTVHMCIMDEASFMPEEVITQVIFPMLSTTDGYAIFLSTPWGRDHFFYRAFVDPNYSVHKVKSSECPLVTKEFLEEQRRNMTPEAYKMEYEAEFVEAATSWFSQDLIRSCIDPELELQHDIEALGPQKGIFFGGCDVGKLQDYSVFVAVRKEGDLIKLVFLKEFPLETPYSHVIGFIVRTNKKFHFNKILIDKSGVGEAVTEEIKAQGLANAEGQTFTAQSKGEMLGYLKVKMQQGLFRMPYDRRLCEQINEQRYEYMKSGQLKFWHPTGSHDDQLWALALAIWASREPAKGERDAFIFY
jgi:phage FluMu gp28-like protein